MEEEEFLQHQKEINEFVKSKIDVLGLHQTIRLLGHRISSETSSYRANNVEDGNPELVTLLAQDHASTMAYWAEVECGVETISGMETKQPTEEINTTE